MIFSATFLEFKGGVIRGKVWSTPKNIPVSIKPGYRVEI
jgi:hypothetical protein